MTRPTAVTHPYITRLRWSVTVTVAAGTDEVAVRRLAEQAHDGCYVASSLAVPVEVGMTVAFR